jgi:hypothetical protein
MLFFLNICRMVIIKSLECVMDRGPFSLICSSATRSLSLWFIIGALVQLPFYLFVAYFGIDTFVLVTNVLDAYKT